MTDAILRPTSDDTTEWITITPHWNKIEEVVEDPTAGDGFAVGADENDAGQLEIQNYDPSVSPNDIQDVDEVTQIVVKCYIKEDEDFSAWSIDINLGGWVETKYLNPTASYAWYTTTWTGLSGSQADLDSFQIKYTCPTTMGKIKFIQLDTSYAIITYTPAVGAYGNNVDGVQSANIGKVMGVLSVNIAKVNGQGD